MPTIAQIISTIEEFAPLAIQESWDNCGVQVGYDLGRQATGAVLTLDVTKFTLDEAIASGANMIISHHPLIFDGLRSVTDGEEAQRIVIEAIRAGIVVYSSHTAIDSCKGGINDKLAQILDLSDIQVISPSPIDCSVGLGRYGTLSKPLSGSEFAALLKAQFNLPSIRYSDSGRPISRVALCGGGGGSMISDVELLGVDAYVCGDLKYHNFDRAITKSLSMFDIGHFESEICVLDIFSDVISKKFPTFVASKSAKNFITYS